MATLKNTTIDDTGFLKVASGTTLQRPGSPLSGQVRYNSTTGNFEGYGAAGWHILSPVNLAIYSVAIGSNISFVTGTGAIINPSVSGTLTITGFNFTPTCTVKFDNFTIPSGVTVVDPKTITVATGNGNITAGSYSNVSVTNEYGQTATIAYPIVVQGGPQFSTATNLGTFTESALSITVAATSPGSSSIVYSAQTSTGNGGSNFGLPTGLSINSSTGVITGSLVITGTTTYNITIRATDNLARITAKDFTFILTDNSFPTITSPSAGSLGSIDYEGQIIVGSGSTQSTTTTVATIVASDPESNGISYVVSSGTLPAGITINSSSGVISGSYIISPRNAASQVFNFGIQAVDAFNNRSAERAYSLTVSVPYLYRQTATTGYVTAGYKSSVAWRSVNRFNMASEVTFDLSDIISTAHNYKCSGFDADRQYSFGVNANGQAFASGSLTIGFNMRTETSVTTASSSSYTRAMAGSLQDIDGNQTACYILGGFTGTNSDRIEKFTFGTQSMSIISNTIGDTTNFGDCWGATSPFGYGVWTGATGFGNLHSGSRQFTYSNETSASWATALSSAPQQKLVMTKLNSVYGGNGGTYGDSSPGQAGAANFRKTLWATQAQTVFSKGYNGGANCGEENWITGQSSAWGLGVYDDAQNNNAIKLSFAVDIGITLNEASRTKGTAGRSSATTGWRD